MHTVQIELPDAWATMVTLIEAHSDHAVVIVSRKNDEAYVPDLTEDILAAVDWHVSAGYAGPELLFSRTSVFPRYIDNEALFAEAHGNLAATAAQGHGEAASPAPPA